MVALMKSEVLPQNSWFGILDVSRRRCSLSCSSSAAPAGWLSSAGFTVYAASRASAEAPTAVPLLSALVSDATDDESENAAASDGPR